MSLIFLIGHLIDKKMKIKKGVENYVEHNQTMYWTCPRVMHNSWALPDSVEYFMSDHGTWLLMNIVTCNFLLEERINTVNRR